MARIPAAFGPRRRRCITEEMTSPDSWRWPDRGTERRKAGPGGVVFVFAAADSHRIGPAPADGRAGLFGASLQGPSGWFLDLARGRIAAGTDFLWGGRRRGYGPSEDDVDGQSAHPESSGREALVLQDAQTGRWRFGPLRRRRRHTSWGLRVLGPGPDGSSQVLIECRAAPDPPKALAGTGRIELGGWPRVSGPGAGRPPADGRRSPKNAFGRLLDRGAQALAAGEAQSGSRTT